VIRANLGNSYFREDPESNGRALTKWRRNGAHAQARQNRVYRRPCERNRVTGSITACRLKIQRATANPIAA
jgi:hypothetical protein